MARVDGWVEMAYNRETMPRFRFGCVPYLNAKPLIAYYDTPAGRHEAEIVFGPPSALAGWVDKGEVDVALASSFFAVADPAYTIVPEVSISSRGAVDSVRLFSKVPFGDIGRIALDVSSMTSNHLVRIILAERYSCKPEMITLEPNLAAMLAQADAAVLIGDTGMDADGAGLNVLDLGAAWNEMTGLPFVWAAWLGRGVLDEDICSSLVRAKTWGLERIQKVAEDESKRLGWPQSRCLRYLAEVIDYDLTSEHLDGLQTFSHYCAKMGFTNTRITSSRA